MLKKLSFKIRSFFKKDNWDKDATFEVDSYKRFYRDFEFDLQNRLAARATKTPGIKPHIDFVVSDAQEALLKTIIMNAKTVKEK